MDYIRHQGEADSPALIVQTKCDAPEDEATVFPVAPDSLADLPYSKALHHSAKNDRGRAALDEALRDAVGWLRDPGRRGVPGMARGGRVFVVLSDKYLRSPYCVFELFKAWETSKAEGEAFLRRVRVYCLPDVQIGTPLHRARYAKVWRDQHDELAAFIEENGANLLGEEDFRQFKRMQAFYGRVSDIPAVMNSIVRPDTFEQLAAYGFEGLPPAPG